MAHPTLVLLVRFKSALSLDEVMKVAESRADEFRALTGLQQKYYLYDEISGEVGGLYLWESAEAFDQYRESELRASIASQYRVEGEPSIQVFTVQKILRETAS